MLIDAREQFEDEPKSFGNKRHRITDAHQAWIKHRYHGGWSQGYADDHVKIFKNTATKKDFAYHKVSVVFWQTDEKDRPAIITEAYQKAFTPANVAKDQEFYCRKSQLLPPPDDKEPVITFNVRLAPPETVRSQTISLTLKARASFSKLFDTAVLTAFAPELELLLKQLPKDADDKKAIKHSATHCKQRSSGPTATTSRTTNTSLTARISPSGELVYDRDASELMLHGWLHLLNIAAGSE